MAVLEKVRCVGIEMPFFEVVDLLGTENIARELLRGRGDIEAIESFSN
jgi:hypothetical protein